jgi:hypothetical protein
MGDGIHVTSFGALEELDVALGRFAGRAAETLEALAPEIERKLSALEERAEECERAVRYWQRTYEDADPEEDDVGMIAGRLEEAEDSLREVRMWLGRVDQCHRDYLASARRVALVAGEHTDKARSFLRRKIAELYDYAGMGVGGFAGAGGATSWTPGHDSLDATHPSAGATPGDAAAISLTDSSLPPGFSWVRLDEIDPRELSELPEDEKSGVSADAVRAGLLQLRDAILPEIKAHPEHASSDHFYELDRQAGREPGVGSLQGVYDAFFGNDHIWVDRRPGESLYEIGNGRHRIKAARDLGLSAVPAKKL